MSTQTIGTFWQRRISHLLVGTGGRSRAASGGVKQFTVRLVRNEPVHLRRECCLREINVRQGVVWLTGTPACGDIILHRGDRFEFGNQWPFVVQALEDAEIELSV